MKRWGQVQRDLDYAQVAQQVFLSLDAGKVMKEAGQAVTTNPLRIETIMGKSFDPANPAPWTERSVRAG